MIYKLILLIRNAFYRSGKHSRKADVPTICVGNVTVGGTGKTPHTEMILRTLLRSDEWGARNLAVLSRGYKRKSRGFQQVTMDGTALFCGDEPLQIKKKLPVVTVAVDKDRIEGCDLLCHPEKLQEKKWRKVRNRELPAADLIVLDDAFQYRKLKADLNIVLVDYNRPVCKDKLLPFGRLRDLPSRLREADVIIVTKCPYELDEQERAEFAQGLGFAFYNMDRSLGVTLDGQEQKLYFTRIAYSKPEPLLETSDPRYIYAKSLVLFTGIADDTPLCRYLSDTYKIVKRLQFPDHHRFTKSDFAQISAAVHHNPTVAVAATEKDAQRVRDYAALPQELRDRMFFVPISVEFLTPEEQERFEKVLVSI